MGKGGQGTVTYSCLLSRMLCPGLVSLERLVAQHYKELGNASEGKGKGCWGKVKARLDRTIPKSFLFIQRVAEFVHNAACSVS